MFSSFHADCYFCDGRNPNCPAVIDGQIFLRPLRPAPDEKAAQVTVAALLQRDRKKLLCKGYCRALEIESRPKCKFSSENYYFHECVACQKNTSSCHVSYQVPISSTWVYKFLYRKTRIRTTLRARGNNMGCGRTVVDSLEVFRYG